MPDERAQSEPAPHSRPRAKSRYGLRQPLDTNGKTVTGEVPLPGSLGRQSGEPSGGRPAAGARWRRSPGRQRPLDRRYLAFQTTRGAPGRSRRAGYGACVDLVHALTASSSPRRFFVQFGAAPIERPQSCCVAVGRGDDAVRSSAASACRSPSRRASICRQALGQ